MGWKGRQIVGLTLCLLGVFGVCLTCSLPMWREASFVGANIVSAQSVWDGLWLHCIFQATGQMQCRRQTLSLDFTPDLQAGRALTLLSIFAGLLGFIVTLLGGGLVSCRGNPSNHPELPSTSPSKKKAVLLGGALILLSAILCLISVSWSAGRTIRVYNDPLLPAPLRREVGSSIYIGGVSSLLLLLSGTLICFMCWDKECSYMPYSSTTHFNGDLSRTPTLMSDLTTRSNTSLMNDYRTPYRIKHVHAQVYSSNSQNNTLSRYSQAKWSQSVTADKGKSALMGSRSTLGRDIPTRSTTAPHQYYY
ncbi:claudin-4-like [Thalassophryne amazonica]|uniref:claudin-4-like n=1 Tax=Thalassophryne amazonica TaxID=390379 RepID=UPI001470F37E|nr:claudin-4-like [Thalassophryne amazonica]